MLHPAIHARHRQCTQPTRSKTNMPNSHNIPPDHLSKLSLLPQWSPNYQNLRQLVRPGPPSPFTQPITAPDPQTTNIFSYLAPKDQHIVQD